jgi:hypothetical protein
MHATQLRLTLALAFLPCDAVRFLHRARSMLRLKRGLSPTTTRGLGLCSSAALPALKQLLSTDFTE